ncbi:fasciclin domain-containing protein [Aquabacterium lacunae]|uniref:Fasciclin domain-containing protein n=1 Tax=Aquabacterium lacunae TaxID=2528630 RepID=A0A4Q9H362_9BURK|nr:fasciclin domain-containing protein [Aquabacterium lacunae]TBO28795.1 fasciclin domain-containing protein [Aquabacterium lacunae]
MTTTTRFTAWRLAALTLASAFVLGGCASTTPQAQLAAQAPELSTFQALVRQAGLDAALADQEVTIFAPTDDAFKDVPAATLDKLAKDPEQLRQVLNFHMVNGKVLAANVTSNTALDTLQGAKLNVSKAGDYLVVEEAMATRTDLSSGKATIHVVDRVLMPPKKK